MKHLEETLDQHSDVLLKTGDVLVQRSNTPDLVGTTAIFEGASGIYAYPDLMMRLRFKSPDAANWFWRYANGSSGRQYFVSVAAGSTGTMPKISGNTLREMPLPWPPPAEQRAIATALSDVDALSDGLTRLIAKKRDLKQAAMQQLLTGQTRLPGFSGAWEMRLLGDVAHITTGKRNNQDKVDDGIYPFFVRSATVERINSYSHDCEAILVPGEGQIGSIFHYISGRFDVHQRVYAISQFAEDVWGRYVHLYMSEHFGAWAMQNTVKATVDSLRLPTFQSFQLHLPPTLDEQSAIAAVLSDMDAELIALDARLVKTRALKQAMMQELLTGKTRLI
ncbi:MAG: restriction endonuclease subunit S [Pusillimonas sp.]